MMPGVSLRPSSFKSEPLCDLCFEEALQVGAARSSRLKPDEFDNTSIRPCVDGLMKRYKAFARQSKTSVFSLVRDASWYWASFCETDETLRNVCQEYFLLLRDLTEKYSYIDLEDRMDVGKKVKEIGYRGRPLNIMIPREAHGAIADCGVAVGTTFSIFLQVGLGWALSKSSQGVYRAWLDEVFTPLFDEMMAKAKKRLDDFLDIRDSVRVREMRKQGGEPWTL